MITVEVDCSTCGKARPLSIEIETLADLQPIVLKKAIEREGWIVQINGEYMDTYCSKECAK